MKVVATYSHKNGLEFLKEKFDDELSEINNVIKSVDASHVQTKISKEKTMPGQKLLSPITLNKLFASEFVKRGWKGVKIDVKTKVELPGKSSLVHSGFRAMDFVKNKLGVEVQFGKYAFMVYNVAAKMTIFHNQKIIEAGVEIVPMKSMADKMSSGVSFFEQFKTDLEMRGVADIDIPVLIIGIVE
jgi:hypothetical protein